MDMGDFFRSIFGLKKRLPPSHDLLDDDFNGPDESPIGPHMDEDENEFSFFFGNNGHGNLNDMFDHFHGDMFRQMESLHRQMDEMMKGFGVTASDHFDPFDNPRIKDRPDTDEKNSKDGFHWFFNGPSHNERPKHPRDFMLKEGDKESLPPHSVNPTPKKPDSRDRDGFHFKWDFNFPHSRQPPNERERKEDTDLDGKVNQGDVLDMIKRSDSPQERNPTQGKPYFFSSGSSFSMTTITGPDGRVEQKKVVRDSSGREQTTVTRSIGDQTHSVTTTLDDEGRKEHREDFKNMDEKDISKFDERWSQPRSSKPLTPTLPFDPASPLTPNDQSLFSRLFGR